MRPIGGLSFPERAGGLERLNPDEWLPLIYVSGHFPKLAILTDRGC